MVIDSYKHIHIYYLGKLTEFLDGGRILKADVWNEIRPEMEGTGVIAGEFGKTVCVELMPSRAKIAQEMFKDNPNIEVVNGDLRSITFDEPFDAVICLGTANYMPYSQAKVMLQNIHKLLRPGGRLYLSVWLTTAPSREAVEWGPNDLFHHNIQEFPAMLWDLGYDVVEREEIFGSNATPVLVGYKCRAVPVTKQKPLNIMRAVGTDGWMKERELFWLAYQARKHKKIVELGSFKGRSTLALAENTDGVVFAIDNFYGPLTVNMRPEERETILHHFMKNTKDFVDTGKVKVIQADHKDADVDFTPDMVFIDGSHEYDDVKRDILKWKKKVNGGLLCGHDATRFDLPRVLPEVFGDKYRIVDGTDIWYAT